MTIKLESRLRRVDREGSPFFRYDVPNIAPKDFLALEMCDIHKSARKYFPLDFFRCTNNSSVNILVSLSPGQDFLIPARTIIAIEDRSITQLRVRNLSTTNNTGANKISLTLQRLPLTEDRLLRRKV